ncbi:hypothetical protein IMG5_027530 [Ichthyophthirius multifiliis]|uniref:Transmembrane protein n=1 Tax=Ichthyophthirius multifiliis TaxID=5932 RepID=G0QL99_ICHMU|nr:hypothetical protein IMG5_027530 [Ichthyophthirius multifiliis]EGR34006.1 hypothetical protein IMG5_027530 [Ichthyophthirius multifiliis]|eukprot:XP_004039310.1 hypothetical protein IMG5_027530 [Ichthyophthirius multifiliis]
MCFLFILHTFTIIIQNKSIFTFQTFICFFTFFASNMTRITSIIHRIFKFFLRTFCFTLILFKISIPRANNFFNTEAILQIKSLCTRQAFVLFYTYLTIQVAQFTLQSTGFQISAFNTRITCIGIRTRVTRRIALLANSIYIQILFTITLIGIGVVIGIYINIDIYTFLISQKNHRIITRSALIVNYSAFTCSTIIITFFTQTTPCVNIITKIAISTRKCILTSKTSRITQLTFPLSISICIMLIKLTISNALIVLSDIIKQITFCTLFRKIIASFAINSSARLAIFSNRIQIHTISTCRT